MQGRGLDCIDKMEKEVAACKAHIVVLPYHGQGHMNPLLQVSKRLAAKGIKVTVTTTLSNTKAMQAASTYITSESIYDDFSEGGSAGPGGFKGFLGRFEAIGSRNLTSLLRKFQDSENPVACLLYDANVTWASNVVNEMGIRSAAFLTHSCAFFASLYLMHCDLLGVVPSVPIQSMPGLPELRVPTMPSLGPQAGRYPPIIRFLLRQFDNIEKADWVLFNSFHMLEEEVVNQMLKLWPVRPIGPTLPSFYLDNRVEVDDDYAFNVHKPNTDICLKWLDSKDTRSVVYISFGSVSSLSKEQTAELAEALVNSGKSFLWVVRPSEEHTLPTNFIEETSNQGLIVKWSPQLAVLGHDSVGCFISHCGWNSTIEAISLGVPIVAMPQFLDQITDGHFVEHIWQVGIQPKADDKGFCQSVEISRCILGIMQGERGEETRKNAARLKALAKEAVAEGGSSDRNMSEFISQLLPG
ncbi:mogroside I-E synthase-like isoform X1 [Primulina tabacum]|uniref:mogroside I-E synthase-like isoform X1 n=2 Tax=Primulina tabacum TaxID=48773 RepID=UPI003F5978E5